MHKPMPVYALADEYILVGRCVYSRELMSIYAWADEYMHKPMPIYALADEYILVSR